MITQNKAIYVSNSGSDTTGTGTALNPYKTLAKVQTVLANGTCMYLEKGSTFNNDKITLSGRNNIRIDSYGSGDSPVLAGYKAVTGWTDEGGSIWSHQDDDFPDEITNVFIGGVRALMGRYPASSYETCTGGSNSTLIDSGLTQADGYFDGAEIVIRYYDWATGISRVSSYASKTFTFPIYYQDEERGYYYSVSSGKSYFVQNHKNLLASQNQWAYDKVAKKLYIYSASEPSSVVASYGDDAIYVINSKYITVQNIEINKACRCGIYVEASSRIVVDNVDFSYSGIYSMLIQNSNGIVVTNCYGYFQNNDFLNLYKCFNIYVADNIARACGVDIGSCRYMAVFARGGTGGLTAHLVDNMVVRNNEVGYASYCGIGVSYGLGIICEENYTHHFNLNKYDGGGLACNTAGFWHMPERDLYYPVSGRMMKNIVVDGNATQNSYGPYIDNYSYGFEMGYNFASSCRWCIILHESIGNYCHDNTIVTENGSEAGLSYGMTLSTTLRALIANNVYVNKETDAPSFYSISVKTNANTISGNKYCYPLGKAGTGSDNSINKLGTTWYTLATWKADDARVDWDRDTEAEITPSVLPAGNSFPTNDFVFYIVNPAKTVKTVQSTDVPFDDYVDLDGNFQSYPFGIPAYGSKVLVRAPKPIMVKAKINSENIKQLIIYTNVMLDGTKTPATSAFAVPSKTVSGVAVSGNTITLTTAEDNIEANDLMITYTKPGSNKITALYGALEMDTGTKSANMMGFVLTARGTGVGVCSFRVKTLAAITLYLDGTAKFYSDSGGTSDESATWDVSANTLTTVYYKVPSGTANLKFSDGLAINQFYTWGGSTANHPSAAGDISGYLMLDCALISIVNTISGDVSGIRGLAAFTIQSNTTVSGTIKNMISLVNIDIRGTNTLTYDFSRMKKLCVVAVQYNVLTSEQVNTLLAQLWANRDETKPSATPARTVNLSGSAGSGAPTGQGLIDKANLQVYHSPCDNPAYSVWTVTTR